jgi:hypothetical protein
MSASVDLALHPNYFPALPREQAEAYLANYESGTFLIRDSSKQDCCVISLKQSQKVLHLLILRRGRGYGVDPVAWKTHPIGAESFETMSALVSRLSQLQMLKRGLTSDDLKSLASPEVAFTVGSTTHFDLGIQGREELKRLLQQSAQESLEHEYKGMLESMIRNKLTSADVSYLHEWRQMHRLTDADHERILSKLGLSAQEFEQLKDVHGQVDDRNQCIICLDAPRSAVFVDCGHLITCASCAEKVTECPSCRKPKTKILRVYT